ncbi:family 20 glycosylhydrolase [Niabella hibiscisoli]|uniref:family 20 glycosylhydrolase n=1 Tax=Niabella hibiscisoli TaxID=1825928 RepID=UPI00293F5D88|nr:family 20 glycosylhydrolase [Niabella hibiscisoli]
MYSWKIFPDALSAEEKKYVQGGQANLWTEYISNPSKVEYMIFPRVAAISEVLWTPQEQKNWDKFSNRLEVQKSGTTFGERIITEKINKLFIKQIRLLQSNKPKQ